MLCAIDDKLVSSKRAEPIKAFATDDTGDVFLVENSRSEVVGLFDSKFVSGITVVIRRKEIEYVSEMDSLDETKENPNIDVVMISVYDAQVLATATVGVPLCVR